MSALITQQARSDAYLASLTPEMQDLIAIASGTSNDLQGNIVFQDAIAAFILRKALGADIDPDDDDERLSTRDQVAMIADAAAVNMGAFKMKVASIQLNKTVDPDEGLQDTGITFEAVRSSDELRDARMRMLGDDE